jgi:(p)ppGpp synthase/HD superfamily hydrolase
MKGGLPKTSNGKKAHDVRNGKARQEIRRQSKNLERKESTLGGGPLLSAHSKFMSANEVLKRKKRSQRTRTERKNATYRAEECAGKAANEGLRDDPAAPRSL